MASAELNRRIEKVVGYPPLLELGELQRREFHEALLEKLDERTGKWVRGDRAGEQTSRAGEQRAVPRKRPA
jgi:hypothetical protein